jgi:uncharacterized repeat protein (TIGR03943 family)
MIIKTSFNNNLVIQYLDIIALLLWSCLLFKYWFTGQLNLLIHPNYFILVLITSIILLLLSLLKIYQLFSKIKLLTFNGNKITNSENLHSNLLPKGWASTILIVVALLGLITKPIVLASQTAMQRGVIDSLPPTTQQPQAFTTVTNPENRSLIEWVRTLNAYPEPDNYRGQKAKITGFVVHLDKLPDNYLYLSRFILTCCAVDAYPVGIPIQLSESRQNYSPDSWLEIQGTMTTQTLPSLDSYSDQHKRQLVLEATVVNTIPTPKNPYGY